MLTERQAASESGPDDRFGLGEEWVGFRRVSRTVLETELNGHKVYGHRGPGGF